MWDIVGTLVLGVLIGGSIVGYMLNPMAGLSVTDKELQSLSWVQEIATREGCQPVQTPSEAVRNSLPGKLVMGTSHMISSLRQEGMIEGLVAYAEEDKFHDIVKVGKKVSGYPGVLHGGFSAAIMDECFGGLYFNLLERKKLQFSGPAFTARLEVNYLKKIETDSTLLCTCEVESVEGRKLWMKSALYCPPDEEPRATGRALFVVPKAPKAAGAVDGKSGSPGNSKVE